MRATGLQVLWATQEFLHGGIIAHSARLGMPDGGVLNIAADFDALETFITIQVCRFLRAERCVLSAVARRPTWWTTAVQPARGIRRCLCLPPSLRGTVAAVGVAHPLRACAARAGGLGGRVCACVRAR